ncbi:hypothetical protein GCM10011399_37840 [Subtercola lobariae]|uniref:Uncharacterized protein n=1 Tax=Subtercola lobariae TaxID=1588641 RepID=A0A917F108_9MICO|nr:hypothetical protein GCM10011399_37840 [Subtercola lobariae]
MVWCERECSESLRIIRAALYSHPGPAAEVLEVVELDVLEPAGGQVRVRI